MSYFSFKKSKYLILTILLFAVLFYSLWPNLVFAWWLGKNVYNAISKFFFAIVGSITTAFLSLCAGLFKWVASPNFISWEKCPGCTPFIHNPVVDAGWRITRDFTNMLFVLALVIIALATILRYKDYGAKKTLPILIGIALLINFTPLICGIVIDGANIVTYYFMHAGGDVAFNSWQEIFPTEYKATRTMGTFFVFNTFNIIGGLVFLLYALLFLVRYIVIWLLIIVSPLAFFAYIFPKSRSYFHQWWQHFINWSIIGIIPAFMLSLSYQLELSMAEPVSNTGLSGAFMIHLTSITLLLVGFYLSLNTSAVGANIITKGFRKHVVGRTKRGLIRLNKGIAKGMAGAAVGAKRGKGVKGRIGGFFRGGFTKAGLEEGAQAGGKVLERLRLVRPGWYQAQQRETINKAKKYIKNLPRERQHEIAKRRGVTPGDIRNRIAAIETLASDGKLTSKEIEKIIEPKTLKKLKAFGMSGKDIVKAYPTKKVTSAFGKTPEEVIGKMSSKEAREKIQPEALREILPYLNEKQLKEISRRGSSDKKDIIIDYFASELRKQGVSIDKTNRTNLYFSTVKQRNKIEDTLRTLRKAAKLYRKKGNTGLAEKLEKQAKTIQNIFNHIGKHYYD